MFHPILTTLAPPSKASTQPTLGGCQANPRAGCRGPPRYNKGLGLRAWGSGFQVQGLGLRVACGFRAFGV